MRIFKDLSYNHIYEKFYNKNSPLGILINKLKRAIGNEVKFFRLISSIIHWDYNKISLWGFRGYSGVQGYTDGNQLPRQYQIAPILKFSSLILKNPLHRDIYASFDNVQKIFTHTFDLQVKIEISKNVNL
jgi:hypothetical protein